MPLIWYCRVPWWWRSHPTAIREYPAQCRWTSTCATARGRGASTSASPSCRPTVTITNCYFSVPFKCLGHWWTCVLFASRMHSENLLASWPPAALVHLKQASQWARLAAAPLFFTTPPLGSAPWVRAEDVTPCLLCSEAAFRSDEVYPLEWQSLRVLLMQGESIPPPQTPNSHPHDLTFTPRLARASPRRARHVQHRRERGD